MWSGALSKLRKRKLVVMIVVLALTTTMINVAAWAGGDEKGDQGGSEAVSGSPGAAPAVTQW